MIALLGTLAATALPGAATVTSPNVAAFAASPAFINLNRTTSVTLEVAASAGAGADNYLVSVRAPDGSLAASLWYNFSTVGAMSKVLGNASADFQAAVTQVGVYSLTAEWWNATSSSFEPAAAFTLQVTDMLFVWTEFAAGSDPYRDIHNCQLAEEIQRGDGIIARAYVRYASTGEFVNTSFVPSAAGNVTGTLLGTTKVLNYNAKYYFFRAAWQLPWDAPVGVFQFSVSASDGLGNHGAATSPGAGVLGALKVIPAILPTEVWTENATSGERVSAFYPGETVEVVVWSYYDQHFNHNYNFTNTNATAKAESYRLGPDRGGAATAVIGYGAFNATSKTFDAQLASLALAFDSATGMWRGTWAVPATSAFVGNVTVKAFATDGAPTPNAGAGSTVFSTLPRPLPEVITQWHNTTIIENRTVNQTVEVMPPGALASTVAYGLAGVALAAGAGLGFALALKRRGGGSSPSGTAAPAEAKKGEAKTEKKKENEGWD